MLRPNRFSLGICLIVAAGLVIGGCQSVSPGPSPGVGRSVIAGGVTYIEVPTGQGPPMLVSYSEPGKTECPECKAVAMKYFKTGVLDESVCKTCGSRIVLGQGELLQPK